MSTPVEGDPAIDKSAKELLTQLDRMDAALFRNLSSDILGALVAQFGRLSGLAIQHYGIKAMQKTGAVRGELRNHVRNGIHTSEEEWIEKTLTQTDTQ